MGLIRTEDATVEPVTLAEAKSHLRVATSDYDTLITSLITAARQSCEGLLRRTLLQSTWELTLDAFPCAVQLRMPRVIDVPGVQYLDTAGATQTLNPASYQLDAKSEPGWLVPAYGYDWPSTRAQVNAVTITYRCGYGTTADKVPAPIKQWILAQIGAMYENRERVVIDQGIVTLSLGFLDRMLDPFVIWDL